MVIVFDVGNTNIKVGAFSNNVLVASWRMATDLNRTADEYGAMLSSLMVASNIERTFTGAIISSVIPQLNYTISHMVEYFFKLTPLFVSSGIKTGLNIKYENAKELGSDRIISCVAALKKYGAPFVLIDFGTATTFNVVDNKGDFLGGCISLGIKTTMEALAASTARLPRVELIKPDSVIGRNTIKNIQSGLLYGAMGQVVYIIEQIKAELGYKDIKIIATGGISQLFTRDKIIDKVDRELSLEGLNYLYQLNN